MNSDLNNCAVRLKPVSAVKEFNNLSGDIWFAVTGMDNKYTIAQNATQQENTPASLR